ncbi:MAG: M48 family metallopeptidase, partial [Actinobacteria bacterium]|nr:M48 family metallopeptidase [Actinomycetota bacterium]
MPEVVLAGRAVPYLLVRNPRSRHVRMSLTPQGLRVSAPTRLPQAEVDRAVASKERWLLRHSDLLLPSAPVPLVDGMALPLLDGEVELGVHSAARSGVSFRPEEGRVVVAVAEAPEGTPDVRELVGRGYRVVARDWFAWACDHF